MNKELLQKKQKPLCSPPLQIELREHNRRLTRAKQRVKCIKKVYPRLFAFPEDIKSCRKKYIRPDFKVLKSEYECLSKQLSDRNLETIQTKAEKDFQNSLRSYTKKKILNTVWIGSRCIDLFIPNIRSKEKNYKKAMRGLAIEIDGDYHKLEGKQIKDESKGEQLLSLGIGTTHIPNWDFNHPSLQALKNGLKTCETLDSRERKRLWTRIYAYTLAIYLNDKDFFQIFKENNEVLGDNDEN